MGAAGDLNGPVQFHSTHRFGALNQLLDRRRYETPREQNDKCGSEGYRQRRCKHRLESGAVLNDVLRQYLESRGAGLGLNRV